MASKSSFRIFDPYARFLAWLEAPTTPRSWILNGYGKADFSIGTQYLYDKWHPKEETILQYNNLVYIEHVPSEDAAGTVNGKLPDWVGVILPDRTWNFGTLSATAYSAEAILTFRPMPLVKINGTPAAMFKQILEYARNTITAQGFGEGITIQPGTVDDLPDTFSDNLSTNAYEHIQKLCVNANMNWDVTGQIDARGNLQLYANLYARKGQETRLILNEDNTENAAPLLTEQGTPYNVVFGYSQASTAQGRKLAIGRNEASISKFGVLAVNHVFSGITDQAGLRNAAQAMADSRAFPIPLTRRVVLDYGLAFDSLRVGNTVTVKDNNVGFKAGGGFGFETTARILSVDYNDLTNKAPLHLEVL